jgi:hypothetical protein
MCRSDSQVDKECRINLDNGQLGRKISEMELSN